MGKPKPMADHVGSLGDEDDTNLETSEINDMEVISPLSPISPWPPLPSPPRTNARRRSSTASGRSRIIGPDDAVEDNAEYDDDDRQTLPETVPSAPEVYGSLAVLLTYGAFGLYLIWAFAPDGWLDKLGWTWYPDREWAVIVPCYLMFLVLLTYWIYAGLTCYMTPPFKSMSLITDAYANIPRRRQGDAPYYHKYADSRAVPEAVDLPIDLVNRVLYPPRSRLSPSSMGT